jgi:hypothetical protein
MDKSIEAYEKEIRDLIHTNSPKTDWEDIQRYHYRHIQYFQTERLIHLVITLCFAVITILSVYFVLLTRNTGVTGVCLLMLLLLIPYIFHYYKLENGVQRLYKIDKVLQQKKRFEI